MSKALYPQNEGWVNKITTSTLKESIYYYSYFSFPFFSFFYMKGGKNRQKGDTVDE